MRGFKKVSGVNRLRSHMALVLALTVVTTGCVAGSKIRENAAVVRQDLKTARENGAYRCAPRELALAEANLAFTEGELFEGDTLNQLWPVEKKLPPLWWWDDAPKN